MRKRLITKAREDRRMTQLDLASQAGLALKTIGNVEHRRTRASLRTQAALFRVLGISPDKYRDFFTQEGLAK